MTISPAKYGRVAFVLSILMIARCINAEFVSPADLTKMPGWRIMQDGRLGNCITCHTVDWTGKTVKEKQGNFAPPLTSVGAKYNREQLLQWVTDARVIHPNTLMPPYGSQVGIVNPSPNKPILDSEQISAVVDFLMMLK